MTPTRWSPPAPGKSNNGPPGWHSQPPTGSPEEVDYVNACGLGTMELDAIETQTVKQVLGDHAYRVPVSSFKAASGRAFAASGAFQLIGTAGDGTPIHPTTLNLTTPDPELRSGLCVSGNRARSTRQSRADQQL